MKLFSKTSLLACAAALAIAAPQHTQAAPITFDDFNVGEGHFAAVPNFSGTSTGTAASSTADRVTTDVPLEGAGHEKIVLDYNGTGASFRCRFLSGTGTVANNTPFTTTSGTDGWIGFYLKTTATGWETSINLDGAGGAIADMDGSSSVPIIADGQWHLYEWDLDSLTAWGAVPGIGGGHGGFLADGSHTIDSIWFRDQDGTLGPQATIFLDFVALNPNGSIANLLSEPCLATSGVLVGGPISTNSNQVVVTGVDPAATSLKVYQDSGSGMVVIGSKNAGIVAGNNAVTVSGLIKGAQVGATQTINGQESCTPVSGIFVGGGANPPVRVALTIKETTDVGPVGASATDTSSINLHFLGATLLSGGAPVDAPIISPSNQWQAVTFSRGDFVTVGDSANAVGETIDGAGYSEQTAASIQVFAYKLLTNNVRVYSTTPSESAFASSNGVFNIKWTWDAVPDAQGYRLLRNFNGAGFLEHHDVVGTNSYTDNNSGWTNGIVVTPNTARSGPAVKWNSATGDPVPVGTQNSIPGDWGILESIDFAIAADTGPFDLYIDNLQNGTTVFQTFEDVAAGTLDYGFRAPSFSGTTGPNLLGAPSEGVVTNLTADTGTNSIRVRYQFSSTNVNRWLRLTTSGAGTAANPLVNLNDPISFRLLLLPVGTSLPSTSPTISYSLSGNQLVLNWTGTFNLESKTNLNDATWTSVGVSTGPYTNTITGGATFYRLHNP